MVPDPFFLVIEALGQRYRMIAAAYPPVKTIWLHLSQGVTAILDAEHVSAPRDRIILRWLRCPMARTQLS